LLLGTAESTSDTAVEEISSPPLDEEPETDVIEETPETEEVDAPETEALTLEDPRVQELLKGERARLEESYRRRTENAERQAQLQEYERAREQAYNNRVESVADKIGGMLKAALEEGTEPNTRELQDMLTEVSATGLIETVEGMEGWINGFLKEDNPDFYSDIPVELNSAWRQAKTSRRPDQAFAMALKIAAASGEARGYKDGEQAAFKALKMREAERAKTQKIRAGSEANSQEGSPAIGITGGTAPKLTIQQINEMSPNEWLGMGDREERAKILEEAHKAADALAKKR